MSTTGTVFRYDVRLQPVNRMKSLIVIWILAILSIIGAIWYANYVIEQYVTVPTNVDAYTPSTLVVPGTDFNSATDTLQTAAGTFIYQGSNFRVQ
jgi:hypothetical protein